jgi:hypothetical protein
MMAATEPCDEAEPAAAADVPDVRLWGPVLRGTHKYLGGAPTASGEALLGVPAHSRDVVRVNLVDGSVSCLAARARRGHYKWLRGVLAGDGAIYCIPACAPSVLRIAPDGHLTEIGAGALPAANAHEWRWHGGTLGSDGNVYAIPANAERVLRVVVATGRVELIGPPLCPGLKNKWYGGIRGADGCIWGVPYNAPSCMRIDPARNGQVDLIGSFPAGGYKWHGGCRSICGRWVIGIPSHHECVLRIDTAGGAGGIAGGAGIDTAGAAGIDTAGAAGIDTAGGALIDLLPTGVQGKYKWGGGVADGDGAVWAVPSDADCIARIVPATGEVRLSVLSHHWIHTPARLLSTLSLSLPQRGLGSTQ